MSFHFDLVDLQLFLNVIDGGSITAGASRSHLALASASARIQGMESSLGAPLLLRSRRGVTATPPGHALALHARALLQQTERLRGDLAAFAKGQQGRVRLHCNSVSVHEYLPEVLGPFLTRYPEVHIEIKERLPDAIVQDVAEGLCDLGIVSSPADTARLQTFPFRSDRLVLVVGIGHPLDPGGPATVPASVADRHPVIGLSEGSALQAQWEAAVAKRGQRLVYRVRVPSFEAQCRLVEHGAGVALIPEVAAQRLGRDLRLRILELSEPVFERQLNLCVRRIDELPAYVRVLLDFLRR